MRLTLFIILAGFILNNQALAQYDKQQDVPGIDSFNTTGYASKVRGLGRQSDEECRSQDASGQRIYKQNDSTGEVRCADNQTRIKYQQCVNDPNWGQAFWVGQGNASRLVCARTVGYDQYNQDIIQFEGQQPQCPRGNPQKNRSRK